MSYDLEAAKLYTKIGLYEKAVTIYIKLKMFKSAEDLMDKIKSPKLLIQLAKMKEIEKLYQDAEKAYEAAKDWENVIRLNIMYLDNSQKARQVLMEHCKTEAAALMMAEYYEKLGRKKETIEYLLIARRYAEAFTNAQSYNEMQIYGEYMLENSKSNSMEKLLFGLGIKHVGKKTAKILSEYFNTMDNLINASSSELSCIPDIGDVIASSIIEYFESNMDLINKLKEFNLIYLE